jgi:hypothetical protein
MWAWTRDSVAPAGADCGFVRVLMSRVSFAANQVVSRCPWRGGNAGSRPEASLRLQGKLQSI